MERLMQKLSRGEETQSTPRTLELNPHHPAVESLAAIHAKDPKDARIELHARLLFEQAVIAEGSKLPDPAAFAARINSLLIKDAAG